MCKTTENRWFYQKERDRLKIRAFSVRCSISEAQQPLPESITLLYLPRITGGPLEINDSKIRSDSAAFVTLHRVRSAEQSTDYCSRGVREFVFASREQVRATEGVRFEVYLRDDKILKGIIRRDVEGDEWKLDCKCALESELVGLAISEAAICLTCDENVEISEKVEMVMRRRRRKTCRWLEEIPEEREFVDVDSDHGCTCCDDDDTETSDMENGSESDGADCEEEMETDMEVVRWAVDVGIWVVCLGVGYLVSKASSKSLRRRRFL